MTVRFFDRQDAANPANGSVITDATELRALLSSLSGRPPFFAELIAESGFTLLLGLGSAGGCAQCSPTDSSAPYLMAVSRASPDSKAEMSFLMGDTPSPVPGRYALPHETVVAIAEAFLETGHRSADVAWEEI